MRPSFVTKMFSGFRSRWTIPFSCAAASPCAICTPYSIVLRWGSAPRSSTARKLSPSSKLGDQKRRAVVLADVMNGENVGMVERGHCPRLLLEATQAVGFAGEGFRKNFQSDIAPQARIFGAINLSHAACAQRRLDFVGTEFRSQRSGPWVRVIIACAAHCCGWVDSGWFVGNSEVTATRSTD